MAYLPEGQVDSDVDIAAGDINGDEQVDIVASQSFSRGESHMLVFQNDGQGNFVSAPLEIEAVGIVVLGDISGR
ncbi:MAG: hypothetical protein KDA92_01280 [Planctomycetales bacterium]|nr:hypothetical protein [Planctomycetales bacterium]